MRDSHTHENDCFGEFHLAIKKQIYRQMKIKPLRHIEHMGM